MAYDVAARRIAVGDSLAPTSLPEAIPMATYGPGNRLRSWNGQTITRDANGNLTSEGSSYVWNAKNRLVSATEPQGVQASFRYDPFDRHVSRTVTCVQTGHVYASINPMHRLTAIEKAPAPWRSHR